MHSSTSLLFAVADFIASFDLTDCIGSLCVIQPDSTKFDKGIIIIYKKVVLCTVHNDES